MRKIHSPVDAVLSEQCIYYHRAQYLTSEEVRLLAGISRAHVNVLVADMAMPAYALPINTQRRIIFRKSEVMEYFKMQYSEKQPIVDVPGAIVRLVDITDKEQFGIEEILAIYKIGKTTIEYLMQIGELKASVPHYQVSRALFRKKDIEAVIERYRINKPIEVQAPAPAPRYRAKPVQAQMQR